MPNEDTPSKIRSIALTGLFILACFYTLYFARAVILPVIVALLFTFLLRPFVRGLKKIKIPEPLGAALILIILLGGIGYGMVQLSGPASGWMNNAPESFRALERKFREIRKPMEKVTKATEELKKVTTSDKEKKTTEVELKKPTFADALLTGTQEVIAKGAVMFILLFFLLASGDLFILKLVQLFPRLREKKKVLEIAHDVEKHVSVYLSTVALINASMGAVLAIGLYFAGMPNPVLWGVMAGLLIFVPYVGPLVGIAIVAAVSFLTFETIGRAIIPPAIYMVIEFMQGNVVTPMILGVRFELNPVAIFIWLIFWGWMWGVVGALLAVPMLTIFKIFCDHTESLTSIGEFLGK